MIDCTKIHSLPVSPQKLLKNNLLTFPLSNVSTEGEMLNRWQPAFYKTLTFKIKGNNSRFEGSLHKYMYDGKNWQDFSLSEIQATIQELSEKFEFDPQKAIINFIEIGVNIPLEYDPDQIINCLVLHGAMPFKQLPIKRETKGNGRISEKDQFTIKIYNKSLQNGLPTHLLRFEIKVTRMKFLERYGIIGLTLADLTKPELYPKFKTMLLDILAGIVIYNPDIAPDKLTTFNDRRLFEVGRFAGYWQQLDRRRKCEKLNRFRELAGTNEILEALKSKISDKWDELSRPDKITTFQNLTKPHIISACKNEQERQITNDPGQINTTIKGDNVRKCIQTGVDISIQKGNSNLLSVSGLKWLKENDPKNIVT